MSPAARGRPSLGRHGPHRRATSTRIPRGARRRHGVAECPRRSAAHRRSRSRRSPRTRPRCRCGRARPPGSRGGSRRASPGGSRHANAAGAARGRRAVGAAGPGLGGRIAARSARVESEPATMSAAARPSAGAFGIAAAADALALDEFTCRRPCRDRGAPRTVRTCSSCTRRVHLGLGCASLPHCPGPFRRR